MLTDGFDHIFKEDLWGESVAVVDHGLIIRSVPAVQLHTAAAFLQSPESVGVSISDQICCLD